jgi:hypothetical protein
VWLKNNDVKIMKYLILVLLMLIAVSCGKKDDRPVTDKPPVLRSDQTIIPAPEKMEWAFGKGYKNYTPNTDDIETAESLLEECFSKESSGTHNPFFNRELNDYYRQFIGVELTGGDKVIMVNCFCRDSEKDLKNWKTDMVLVPDGSNCYFRLTVNIKRKSYYNLMINGHA